MLGTVKWFDAQRGYGFITPASADEPEIFVHATAVERAGLRLLREGDRLAFDVIDGKGGKLCADNLRPA